MNETQLVNNLMELFSGQRFADWYNEGEFDDYITGATDEPIEVLEQRARARLVRMLVSQKIISSENI